MKRKKNRQSPIFNRQTAIDNNQLSIFNIQSKAGFTLIEIGIAIFILAIGLISMLTLFPIGVDAIKKVTQYSNAAVLSESAISKLIEKDIFTDTDIIGTLTANLSYVYPNNDIGTSTPFEDSFANTISAQYSWQAILKSISGSNSNLVRAQIAVFRNFDPAQFGAGTADFINGLDTAYFTPTLPSGFTSKHYVRADNDKFWYRVYSIGTSTSSIKLEGPFLGSTGTGLAFSTTDDIIDIYETMFSKR